MSNAFLHGGELLSYSHQLYYFSCLCNEVKPICSGYKAWVHGVFAQLIGHSLDTTKIPVFEQPTPKLQTTKNVSSVQW